MNKQQNPSSYESILNEICDEIGSLKGEELDDFLKELSLNPDSLLQDYESSIVDATTALKRSRFDVARQQIRNRQSSTSSKVISLDLARKRQILAAISARTAQTKDMTMAARNQNIDAESDLDCFLDACTKLGLIDDDGNPV